MPLLNTEATSLEDQKMKVRAELRDLSQFLYDRLLSTHARGMALFWKNPDGLTPQQVSDAVGADCVALFQMNSKIIDLIQFAANHDGLTPSLLYPTHEYTPHQDGTVTIGQPITQ